MTYKSRQVVLRRVPNGIPTKDDVEVVETDLPEPQDGELLVGNRWLSIEPAVRIRMGGSGSTLPNLPNYQIGHPLEGACIGEVIESRADGFHEGDLLVHALGWREAAIVAPGNPAHRVDRIPRGDSVAPEKYLGLMALQGFTAHVGLFHVANLKKDDVVWVSAAAGAVGMLAVQIAKLNGNKVIASAGSTEKVRFLKEQLGADEAFNYHDGPLSELLKAAAPEGIDVYFDNVGGDHTSAALQVLNVGGRIALCGQISAYNEAEPVPGPSPMFAVIAKNITIKGFLAVQYRGHLEEYRSQARKWMEDNAIHYPEAITHGIDSAPGALIEVLQGHNLGKMLVDLR